jgi:hypothetical protein
MLICLYGVYALLLCSYVSEKIASLLSIVHHHQPINVPTAGAQAFLMVYT